MNNETWINKSKGKGTTISLLYIAYQRIPKYFSVYEYGNMCVKNIQDQRMTDWGKLVAVLDKE
jgi:hypothetical protein